MRRRSLFAAPLAALAAAGLVLSPAHGAETVKLAKGAEYEWTVEGVTAVNPWGNTTSEAGVPGNCFSAEEEATFCDVRILELADAATVEIKIEFEATSDYDLYVLNDKGVEIGHSYDGITDGSVSEQVRLNLKPGTYRIESVYFLAVNSTLNGSIKAR